MNKKNNFSLFLKVIFVLVFLPLVLIWGVWKKTNWNNAIKSLLTFGIVIVFLFLLPLAFKEDAARNQKEQLVDLKKQTEVLEKELAAEKQKNSSAISLPENTEVAIEEKKEAEFPSPGSKDLGEKYKVLHVVDGDTLSVEIDGKKEVLRLIGINTPETVDPRRPVECFGTEASKKAKEILSGKMVMLEKDETQGELDRYNRLLRYVYLEDGTSFNKLMIEEGYAYEYTYNTPYRYQTEFKAAQQLAEKEKRGLWAPDTCNGELHKKTESPPPTTNSNTNAQATAAPTGAFVCNCAKTCSQMSSCAEAQYQLNVCGCSRRDADRDGIACDADCQ